MTGNIPPHSQMKASIPQGVGIASEKEQVLQSLGMYHFVCKQLETNTDIPVTQLSIIIWLDTSDFLATSLKPGCNNALRRDSNIWKGRYRCIHQQLFNLQRNTCPSCVNRIPQQWWVQMIVQTWETSSEELQAEKAHSWNSHQIPSFPASIKKRVSSE